MRAFVCVINYPTASADVLNCYSFHAYVFCRFAQRSPSHPNGHTHTTNLGGVFGFAVPIGHAASTGAQTHARAPIDAHAHATSHAHSELRCNNNARSLPSRWTRFGGFVTGTHLCTLIVLFVSDLWRTLKGARMSTHTHTQTLITAFSPAMGGKKPNWSIECQSFKLSMQTSNRCIRTQMNVDQ